MRWWPWPKRRESKGTAETLEIFKQVFGSNASTISGETVTWKTALEVTTVLAICRVLANGVAQVPLKLMLEDSDGLRRNPARDHPLYRLLHRKPSRFQTSFDFRWTLMLHLVLCGNAFVFVSRLGTRIGELIILEPGSVLFGRNPDRTIWYRIRNSDGTEVDVPPGAMWHVRGPSWNGWVGLEVVKLAREAIGLAIATESQHARLHRNGISPSGVYSVDGTLNRTQHAALMEVIERNAAGESKGKPLILDRAAKWISTTMTGVDSQHLETRRFQVEEICRAFGVMPLMVGYSDKTSTYGSAEQIFLAHVVHTMSPWWTCIEQSIDCNLITDREAEQGYYAKFIAEGLLRGAMGDTADYLTKLTERGIMTRNEARAKLDLNPLDGLDEPLTPVNLSPPGGGADPTSDPVPKE